MFKKSNTIINIAGPENIQHSAMSYKIREGVRKKTEKVWSFAKPSSSTGSGSWLGAEAMVGMLIAVVGHRGLVWVAGGWCMCMNRFPRIHFKHIPFRQAQNAPMRRRRRSTAPAENATLRWSMKLTFILYTVSPIGDAGEGGSGLRRHM